MRNDKWITGLVLVLIGAAFLLNNLGYIDFEWYNVYRLWPVFLVIAGVNLVLANQREAWATVVKALVVVAGFALILFADLGHRRYFWMPRDFHYESKDDDDEDNHSRGITKLEGNSNYKLPNNANIKVARLSISGGATTYLLNDTTADLFNAQTKEFSGKYEFINKTTDSTAVLEFNMTDKHGRKGKFEWDSDKENSATIKLNNKPEWELDVNSGASKIDFDLTKFKIKSFELNGGAGSFTIKLGQPLTETRVEISAGASEINVNVPKNAACSIKADIAISSPDFNGFTKVGDRYETPGFAAAKNKIYIKMNGAISDFNVNRY